MAEGADSTDIAAIYIYIFLIWSDLHGNRLYGVIGLLSKTSGWMGDG